MLPYDPRRLAAIRDFPAWRAAIENALVTLDNRIAGIGAAAQPAARVASFSVLPFTNGPRAGEGVLWLGAEVPPGLLACDGSTVATDAYPDLYAALGDTYSTGDEPDGQFRLPNLPDAPAGFYAVRV